MNVAQQLKRPVGTTRLVVRCLGRFRLETGGGEALAIRTRKARAVLACLAAAGRPMTRDALAALLWSERAPAQARSSVRQSIFELQHVEASDTPVLAVSREEIAVRPELVVTDLALIRSAAQDGDWGRLAVLLQDSEPGLFTDLDGLDAEFDCWLRTQRAHEPSATLEAVVAAAERCRAEAGPRAALDLLAQVVRLDPLNEEAARTALCIAHELGDQGALHRHFRLLRDRLREDLDAEPSAETVALFKRLANGSAAASLEAGQLAASATAPALPPEPAAEARVPGASDRRPVPMLAIAIALVLALAALAALGGSQRTAPVAGAEPVVLAVLPFDEQPRGDGFLATGLWEHTRAALTRNSGLRVLGPSTSAIMARQGLAAGDYRRRFGVTHLLEGSVRRTGEQVLVSVSLSQTRDGVAIWQGMFRGRMGEPFALQDRIANGIEGRLRGRLAPSGGRRAEQIATVPEVYGLYSQARGLMVNWSPENMARAKALLRTAVATDPNYAPAWAQLAAATYFTGRRAIIDEKSRAEAIAAVQRALELAPNLAQAHSTLALVEDNSAQSAEQGYRRAIALDPGYAEAWNWLGGALHRQHRHQEAIAAYKRAVAIDPLLWPAVQNLASAAAESGEEATLDRLLADLARAGADAMLVGSVRADRLTLSGDYSGAVRILEGIGLDPRGRTPPALWMNWFEALSAVGQPDRLHAITDCPEWYAPLLEGKILPPTMLEGQPVSPQEFWTSFFFSHPASRAMVEKGRSGDLVKLYRAAFRDADDFISRADRYALLAGLAPTLSVALRETGSAREADYLLAAAANHLQPAVARRGSRGARAELAGIRAAQGDDRQAIALLDSAIQQGWLPDGRQHALDLAGEPGFRALRGNPRFEALRKRILAHLAKERAELGPLRV